MIDFMSILHFVEYLITVVDCFIRGTWLAVDMKNHRERMQNQPPVVQIVQIVCYVTIYEAKAPEEPV